MKIKLFFAAAALAVTGVSAQASTVSFDYDGVVRQCPDNALVGICGNSLAVDDLTIGSLEVDMAAAVPGNQIGSDDIVSYSFDFGDLSFNSDNSTIVSSFIRVDEFGELDAGSLMLNSTTALDAGVSTLTLNFGSFAWDVIATIDGQNVLIASGIGKASVAPIPVPGALLLFGPALLGFLGLRRRAA